MNILNYPGRLAFQQRVLPSYRAPFFNLLAGACAGGLSLFAGQPRLGESILTTSELSITQIVLTENIHIFSGALYLCYQTGFSRWLESWNPDALIVEANPRYLSTPAAIRWMKRRGRPVIGWGLGAPLAKDRQVWRSLWTRFLGQFDGLIAYSRRGADEYEALGLPRNKVFVAYNAVSPTPTDIPQPKRTTINTSPSILFVGRLQPRKRVDALLRACAVLSQQEGVYMPRLVIIGDGPERQRLQQLAAEIYPSALFVGAKQGDELTPYFGEADLFVLPGTGGLAVQQAMSHGLPVIVAKGDGTQDDLVRAGNGWQIPPDDEVALLTTLREALSDSGRLRKMGAESFRIVSQEINLEKMVESFLQALNSV